MEQIFVNGIPLSETIETIDESVSLKNEKRQKFVRVHGNAEIHITACAVSKMIGVDCLSELEEYKHCLVEPNQKWLENQSDPFAWVKVYHKINPDTDSVITGQVQVIKVPMLFLGESSKECWAELQLIIKKQVIINGRVVNLNTVKLGRHQCYDTRIGEWISETKQIVPKKDAGTHGYIALRLYHQDNLPEIPANWHFEPVYAVIAGDDFYRINAIWQNEEITITATRVSNDSSEIPKHVLR